MRNFLVTPRVYDAPRESVSPSDYSGFDGPFRQPPATGLKRLLWTLFLLLCLGVIVWSL